MSQVVDLRATKVVADGHIAAIIECAGQCGPLAVVDLDGLPHPIDLGYLQGIARQHVLDAHGEDSD